MHISEETMILNNRLHDGLRYYYGLDLASGSGADYTGIVIHSLAPPTKEIPRPIPKLADLYRVKLPLDEQLDMFNQHLFPRMTPTRITSDYTNEKTFTDMLVRDFGKDIVEGIVFGAGSGGTKKMLKDDGAFMLRQGYKFPDTERMRDKDKAELVRILIEEARHEEMRLTPSGRESFDHARNRHNDMIIAWELSVHGCLRAMLNAGGEAVATSSMFRPIEDDEDNPEVPVFNTAEDLMPELKKGSIKINNIWSTL